MADEHSGSCLCGGVRFKTTGKLRDVVACHCSQCRKQTGLYYAATSALAASIAPPSAQDIPQAAFNELKHGGFVVMFRHGKTIPPAGAAEDKSPLDLANCADQAMLSPEGREEARAVGKAFASAGIPA